MGDLAQTSVTTKAPVYRLVETGLAYPNMTIIKTKAAIAVSRLKKHKHIIIALYLYDKRILRLFLMVGLEKVKFLFIQNTSDTKNNKSLDLLIIFATI